MFGFGVLVLGGLAGLAYLASAPEPTSNRGTEPGAGQTLSDLQLSPLSSNAAPRGLEHLGGRVTFVNLWGPWCSYCRVEMPHLNAIFQQHSANGDFQFLSISCGEDMFTENAAELRQDTLAYLGGEGFDFAVHHDPGGKSRVAIAQALGLLEEGLPYPLSLLLDRSGRIQRVWLGYHPGMEVEVEQAILDALRPQAPPR